MFNCNTNISVIKEVYVNAYVYSLQKIGPGLDMFEAPLLISGHPV